MLENPAMYSGFEKTPISCIRRWMEINDSLATHFTMYHRHLIHMCEGQLTKAERRVFNNLTTKEDVADFLFNKFDIAITQTVD